MKISDLQARVKENPANTFYISLSDLMVLLCVFFAVILGMSKIDMGSFERVRTGITGSTKGTLVELAQHLQTVSKNFKGVEVSMSDDGVRLDLESAALFDTGSAVLMPNALDRFAPLFREILGTSYSLDVEGHSDDRPLYQMNGQEMETNWSLSGRRASSVVHHLINYGFRENRLRIVGYASNRPKVVIKDKFGSNLERARAQNRRVSILVK